MVRILIIDTKKNCASLEKLLSSHFKRTSTKVDYFSSPSESWKILLENPFRYDAVFVDVGNTETSIENVIVKTRKLYSKNADLNVVFTTSAPKIAVELFRNTNLIALKRPFSDSDMNDIVNLLRKSYSSKFSRAEKIVLCNRSKSRVIDCDKILYAKKYRHGMIMVTVNGEIEHHCKMDDFETASTNVFFRCNGSNLVNVRHIDRIEPGRIYLDNGDMLPVSRTYKKNLRELVTKWDGKIII